MTSTYLRPFASLRYGIQSHQEKQWKSICLFLLKIYNEKKMLQKIQTPGIMLQNGRQLLLPSDSTPWTLLTLGVCIWDAFLFRT